MWGLDEAASKLREAWGAEFDTEGGWRQLVEDLTANATSDEGLDGIGSVLGLTQLQTATKLRPAVAALPGSRLPAEATGGVFSLLEKAQQVLKEKGASLTDDAPTMVVNDLAGQRMYYILHQILLTAALTQYVVAVSLEHELTEALGEDEDQIFGMTHGENLDFWLSSIAARAPSVRIVVVCTKLDLVSEEVKERRLDALWESFRGRVYERQIADIVCVSSKTGEGVEAVRQLLQAQAKPYDESDGSGLLRYGQPVPVSWFKFQALAKEMASTKGVRRAPLAEVVQLAKECEVDEAEVPRMLREFHDIGMLLWHDEPKMREMVVLDVQWVVDKMTALLCHRTIKARARAHPASRRVWNDLRQGRLSPRLLPELWPELEETERHSLLAYMAGFGLCCRLAEFACPEADWPYIVPSLLPAVADDAAVWALDPEHDRQLRVRCIHAEAQDWGDAHGFLPDTLFFQVVSALLTDATGHSMVDNAFEDLYVDRVVVRGDQRFMLRHYRQQQCLELTVHGGEANGQACRLAAQQLRECLVKLQAGFGVQFRFEILCTVHGERRYRALDSLPHSCEEAQPWLPRAHPPEPEPEILRCPDGSGDEPEPELEPEPAEAGAQEYRTCLDRHYVQLEVRKAKEEGKNIMTVFEKEERRHSFFDYGKAWAKYGGGEWEFLLNIASINYNRQRDEAAAMIDRILRRANNELPPPSETPINQPGCWDFFLSHGQALAGDQVKMLCFLLRQRKKPNGENYTVWYDNDMDDCSTEAMLEGVKGCGNFVLFFSGDPPVILVRSGAPPSAAAVAVTGSSSGVTAQSKDTPSEGIPPLVVGAAATAGGDGGGGAAAAAVTDAPAQQQQTVRAWLSSVKLDVCIAPLAELGYDDDLDMVREGDDDEVADMLRAISAIAGVKKPTVKKFTRELEKLRSEPS